MKRLTSFALAIGLARLSTAETTSSCGKLVDVPVPAVDLASAAPRTPLRRTHSLLELFSEGDGRFVEVGNRTPAAPLPWRVAPGRGAHLELVIWQDASRANDESMPAIVLEHGESWCTSPLEISAGSRLRFEAVALEMAGTLEVESGDGKPFSERLLAPQPLGGSRQTEIALEAGTRSLCFRGLQGRIAVGEPRILAPDNAPDPRPRWIVLGIVDALRGDLLRRDDAPSLLPALSHLAVTGAHYRRTIAPGCHTRASVWPILMGRDLARIDPLQRRQSAPIQSPLEAIYARANLFASHFAEAAGYHSVFLGNNVYLRAVPAFSRYSNWGRTDTGTIDTIERLPQLFERYGDERVFLVYYVSSPHAQSETPRRLYSELRCPEKKGLDECRCSYEARARHADEAIEALQRGLDGYGLSGNVLQVVTSDHGELFGDGMKLEGEVQNFATGARQGAWAGFDRGHGNACHERETDVPLLVHGKGIAPARREEAVSGLDIAPTLLEVMGVAPVGKLDGLPLREPGRRRSIVSFGFCSDSRREGDEQLLWWIAGCRVREIDGRPLEHRAEIWKEGRRIATDRTDPARVRRFMERHEAWLLERLPSEAIVFGVERIEEATLRVTVENGRIVDYGPSGSIHGLDRIEVKGLSSDETELRLRFHGYRGLYHVTTIPPRAKVRLEVEDHPDVVTFVGALQLPLPVHGRAVDPRSDEAFLFAARPPEPRPATLPALRFWWQGYGLRDEATVARELTDFDRVLREWGYIR